MQIIGTEIPESEKKSKKIIKIILIIIAILFIISIALICYIVYLKSMEFKFKVDDVSVSNISEDLFVFEGDTVYVSIKDFAKILGYKTYNGGYKQYSEDTTKCYIENSNEVASFELGSNRIYKTPPESQTDYEYFTVQEPVKLINDKLYITPEGMSVACNAKIIYSKEKNSITVYSLSYLVQVYSQTYTNNAIKENFKNQKALLYNMIVVSNSENANSYGNFKYGVYSLDGQEIIGTKYDAIEFVESTQEFIVTTSDKKVGIITSKGETKVSPQYDELKQIDKDLNLYLATNNRKKGVIEKNGKILIYLEYDEIGVDTTNFSMNDIKNKYLLFDNCIPVKQNNKWGMYDKRGNLIVPIEYDSLGCIAGTSQDRTANNVLTIPEVEGIVICKELTLINNNKQKFYGIVNSLGKELIPIALETIYSVTQSGREEYTMVNNGINYNVIDYIRKLQNEDKNTNSNESTNNEKTNTTVNQNTLTNTVTNSDENSNIITNNI